jgi:hypothetical protein
LHDLVLTQFWKLYRIDNNYNWTDLRIRAESGGVSLNAQSAGVDIDADLDVKGIKHLAQVISNSVINHLGLNLNEYKQKELQEAILQTLIRKFGAKSYEFSLEQNGERLIKAHIYFGMKPGIPGPDSFPHIHSYTTWKNDKDQLAFIVRHILDPQKYVDNEPKQPGLL